MNYNQNQSISYGDTLQLNFENILPKGKKRSFWFSNYSDLSTKVEGGTLEKDQLYIQKRPTDFDFRQVKIHAEYDTKNKGFINKTFEIPLNFKGPTVIDFSGEDGKEGDSKRDRSGSKLLGRNGREGFDGEDGKDGKPGANLSVKIWKPIPDSNYVYVMVTNSDAFESNPDSTYIFRYRHYLNGNPLIIKSNGGDGGKGGDGSDGANGEDGEVDKGKKKSPGDGGDGGKAGNGGKGGNSGFIMVYVHENAKEVIGTIQLKSEGGKGGAPGVAGKAGSGGAPLEGQEAGSNGNPGIAGVNGDDGLTISNSNINVESFIIPE